MNYYNEIDDYAADWIENLIAAGYIPAGIVDRRSIEDVTPADLAGFDQCHFFAGIAGWSLALRIAGIPDDFPIWTGSCPCQPFSAAGAQAGFADERHLWPAFHWLIAQRSPAIVVGEQVASKVADAWIDLVRADMEALGAAFGAVAFPSASVGAPHIRDRTYWMAHSNGERRNGQHASVRYGQGRDIEITGGCEVGNYQSRMLGGLCGVSGELVGLADSECIGWLRRSYTERPSSQEKAERGEGTSIVERSSGSRRLADSVGREHVACGARSSERGLQAGDERGEGRFDAGPTNGFWSAADWLACRDGKWRPVEPGTFPLADGVSSRVGRLRAYGNAINPWQAAEFLMAALP